MSKPEYDIVYLTNTPSFYKVNLWRELARECRLLVVLLGFHSDAVNVDLDSIDAGFEYRFLYRGNVARRNRAAVFCRLVKLMSGIKARHIVYSGWLSTEFNLYALFSPRRKNVCICESTLNETSFAGLRGALKRRVITRMGTAMPSGIPHNRLFDHVGFKRRRITTGGVGLINTPARPAAHDRHTPLRFIYVGRLAEVKDVATLIEAFNANGRPLTIVGDGPLRSSLEARANANIEFRGFVDNNDTGRCYADADVFLLPSRYEPWGLVVEEAIYNGLPVVVSNRVGCREDLVEALHTGVVFEAGSVDSLQSAIEQIERNYDAYASACRRVDFHQRNRNQLDAYLQLTR